ncbi:MAG: STAS domain-containing protein, partial [Candidatus Latescibacteria bacterium]|nr:STAS domain-containing protein [Candidatus Latescibacterota bacterium]
VLFLTVYGNLIQAVGVGMILACVLFMKQSSDTVETGASIIPLDDIEDAEDWRRETVRVGDILINQGLITEIQLNDVLRKQFETVRIGDIMISQGLITQEQLTDALKKQKKEQKNSLNRVYIKHLDGPIFFGFAARFQEMMTELDDEFEILIIEMSKVPYVDQSGLYVLEDSILRLQNNKVLILMTGLQPQPLDMLKKIDIIPDLVPDSHVFNKFEQCKTWIDQNIDFDNK